MSIWVAAVIAKKTQMASVFGGDQVD